MSDPKLLASLSRTSMEEAIDPDALQEVLSKPPFINLPGAMNVRDLGAYTPGYIKPGVIYRSGTLDYMPESTRPLLRSQLGISKIFDYRRKAEAKQPLCDVEGIELLSCPFKDGQVEHVDVDLPDFVTTEGVVSKGYRDMYDVILDGYITGYKKALEALKTADESHAILYHCTGGKDRTGVLSALLLDLMGAPVSVIAEEYALTRIGHEPFRANLEPAQILSFAGAGAEMANRDGLTTEDAWNVPGVRGLLTTNAEVMVDFMERLKEKYGSAEGYLKEVLGFGDDDVRQIRDNLKP